MVEATTCVYDPTKAKKITANMPPDLQRQIIDVCQRYAATPPGVPQNRADPDPETLIEQAPPELQREIIDLLNKHAANNVSSGNDHHRGLPGDRMVTLAMLLQKEVQAAWEAGKHIEPALISAVMQRVYQHIRPEIYQAIVRAGEELFAAEHGSGDQELAGAGEGNTDDGWQVYTLADAYAPREPLRWLVDRLILAGSLPIPYGMPGGFKSMLLADMCVCVAGGIPWLEPLPGQEGAARQTSQCPVIWFDFDNGSRRTGERFGALARARGLPEDTPLYYVSMPTPWLDAGDPASMARMRRVILGADAGLAVVDNLGVIRGKAEENGADMAMVMSNFRQLVEETGCAIMPIHHTRKSNGTVTRAGESLRGHSSIEASADLALLIEREPASPVATIKSTKSRDIDVEPFGAIFTYDHDEYGELHRARFWAQPIEDNESPHAVRAAILDVLAESDGEPNQTEIVRGVQEMLEGMGRNKILGELALLEQANKIRSVAGPRNSKRYFSV